MVKNIKTDVCIVGAGPAGTTASMFLSKYGIDHVMVERNALPFDKVCGEAFRGRVMNVLREIDPAWANALIDNKIIKQFRAVNWLWHPYKRGMKLVFTPILKPYIKAKRRDFDYALLQKAEESKRLTYIDNCNITQFDKHANGVTLVDIRKKITIEAKLVLMCVGDKPNSLQKVFPDYKIDGIQYLALRLYFENVDYEESDYASEVHFYNKPFIYYIYTTRLPNNQAMAKIFVSKPYAQKTNLDLEFTLRNSIATNDKLQNRFRNARVISKPQGTSILLGSSTRKLSDERFLFAGSAIGSVHILTGVGVGNAMRSGQMAAFWAAESLRENNFSATFLKNYDDAITKHFKEDFKLNSIFLSMNLHNRFSYIGSKIMGCILWLLSIGVFLSDRFKAQKT